MKHLVWGLLLLLSTTVVTAAEPPVAIIGALSEEIKMLDARLEGKQTVSYLGLNFFTGKLNGRQVVLVKSGMGKVNAAMTTAVLLDRFHPSMVIFTGIAGGLDPAIQPGDLVIGSRLIQHDYGTFTPQGLQPGPTENPRNEKKNPLGFSASPQLVALAQQAAAQTKLDAVKPGVPTRAIVGVIVTGDTFVASPAKSAELRQQFQAAAVEMEGAAIAQVCFQQECPFLIIRCISDRADAGAEFDFNRFCRIAADNSARLVETMVKLLPAELDKK